MMNDLYISTYNPDVLSCIANLSSDEVFTPPEVANAVIDMLPQELSTIEEVYEDYCANGRGDRSHNTIKRQDTLWRTYLKADFGKKRFNGISLGEIQDYLANKYYVEGYSYRYVESFLKMFYLFFGQAYSRNYIPAELYNQFCVNKETKIRMPKIKPSFSAGFDEMARDEARYGKAFEGLLKRYFG